VRTRKAKVDIGEEAVEKNGGTILKRQDRIEVVGLEFDLGATLYRMSPKWVEKAAARISTLLMAEAVSAADFYKIAGNVVWRQFALKSSLCRLPETLATMSKIGKAISSRKLSWGSKIAMSDALERELQNFVEMLKANEWQQNPTRGVPTIEMYSDASDAKGAFVALEDGIMTEGLVFAFAEPERHIFLKELQVALCAIQHAIDQGHKSAHLYVDNMAVSLVLQRKASTNYLANRNDGTGAKGCDGSTCDMGTNWEDARGPLHEGVAP
jgi:hypothetical protein